MLETGQSVSHYRVGEKLGAGGMGVVYRAEDTNLNRDVAIKVLPDIFRGDPERLARFEREAKLLASLNHPNIATIHGLEQAEGHRFLVMELVEGETLAQRISRGSMPVDEALEVCRQITEGLEAAHDKGIIHRDLKPANVKVTPEGKAKILDFGLAKAFQEEQAAMDVTHSPTLTDQMTRPGVILGTAAYMSPEQARGKIVTKGTDIWAFGCLLYECLSGKRAFEGETVTETMAAILRGEPDWGVLPSSTPDKIIGLLKRCLRKDPKERLHDIADARIEISEAIRERSGEDQPRAIAAPRISWKLVSAMVAAAALMSALMIGIIMQNRTQPATVSDASPVIRVSIGTETAKQAGDWSDKGMRPNRTALAYSPDGKWLVFWGLGSNGTQLFRRGMADGQAEPIAGSEGGSDPFFSPDGQYVGFWSAGKLKKVPVGGGTPVTLCEVGQPWGISWATNNKIFYSLGTSLFEVSADGGKPSELTRPDPSKSEIRHILPHTLPGGETLLFNVCASVSRWDNPKIEALSLKTGERKLLVDEGSNPCYVRTGHLLFVRRGTLFAAAFDLERLQVTGTPVPLIEGVMHSMNEDREYSNTFAAQFAVSDSGSLAYIKGGTVPDPDRWLLWVDPQKQSIEPIISDSGAYFAPRLSPDGKQAVYASDAKDRQIWVCDLERRTKRPLTARGLNSWPIWSPDGKRIAWLSEQGNRSEILWAPIDDPNAEPEVLIKDAVAAGSWSPDGNLLAFVRISSGQDIWIMHAKEKSEEPFIGTPARERQPEFSPDGRYLAYTSNETGRDEVYVRPYPGPGKTTSVSTEGGSSPIWSSDGRKLFYLGGPRNTEVMAVDVNLQPEFSCGKTRLVCDYWGIELAALPGRGFDIDPRNPRFLAIGQVSGNIPMRYADLPQELLENLNAYNDRSREWLRQKLKSDSSKKLTAGMTSWLEQKPLTQISLVINWFEELKQKVPVPKK
jgi:serine/threonine protein kinase/sugar lactone lactonase YvrE